jgi:hypothetical protein
MSDERRINRRLMKYWEALCKDRKFPAEEQFDADEVEEIWDSCFLVKVADNGGDKRFCYTYLGRSLVDAYGEDFTGADISKHMDQHYGMRIGDLFNKVFQEKRPISDESDFKNRRNITIKYRLCMLPLGRDDEHVEYILGGMKWRAF